MKSLNKNWAGWNGNGVNRWQKKIFNVIWWKVYLFYSPQQVSLSDDKKMTTYFAPWNFKPFYHWGKGNIDICNVKPSTQMQGEQSSQICLWTQKGLP